MMSPEYYCNNKIFRVPQENCVAAGLAGQALEWSVFAVRFMDS